MKPLPPQASFDFEHNLPAGMETFTVRFLAGWFKTSDRHWINLIEDGQLTATNLGTKQTKSMYRVPRRALVEYLNKKKTA